MKKRSKLERKLQLILEEMERDIKTIKEKDRPTAKDDKNKFKLKQKIKIVLNELAKLKYKNSKNKEKKPTLFKVYTSKEVEYFKNKIRKIILEES